MANDVTPPPRRRRDRSERSIAAVRGGARPPVRGTVQTAPELLAFVKALARDLARADAEALDYTRQQGRHLEDACGGATDVGLETGA